jgi:cytochrome b involved in lipid metabolism
MKFKAYSSVLLTAVFLSAVSMPAQGATITGTTCAKVGTSKTVSKVKYVCVKSGNKMIWNKATAVVTTPSSKPSISASPSASSNGGQTQLTLEEIKKHDSGTSCWTIISGNVFDLTNWIPKHPGGPAVIRAICGKDGTSAFEGQHAGQGRPASQLSNYLLGKLGASVKL